MFKQYRRIRGLSHGVSHRPLDGDQTFEGDRQLQSGGLPNQGEFLLKGTKFGLVQDIGPENGRKVFYI